MNYPHIAKKLIDYLEEKISTGQFQANSKLPSLRSLSGKFEIDINSVRKAIDYLESAGIVEKRQGSGNYVRGHCKKTRKQVREQEKIAVLLGDKCDVLGVYATVLLGMHKTASEREVQLLQSFNYSKLPVEIANAQIAECSGAVLLGADEYGDTYKSLNFRVPIIAVCTHDSFNGALSLVDIDPFDTALQAVDFFSRRGVKRVVVISHKGPAFLNRGKIFSALWEDEGGTVEYFANDAAFSFSSRCGYLFTTGTVMQEYCLKYKSERGRLLSADFPILGIDGKGLIDPNYEKAPSIAIDWQLAGRYALEECLYRIANPGASPRRIYIPGRLHE